jgi:DNA-binding MarR family transcriptional regulator
MSKRYAQARIAHVRRYIRTKWQSGGKHIALAIIDDIAEHGELQIPRVAERLGMSRQRVHVIAKRLAKAGILYKTQETGRHTRWGLTAHNGGEIESLTPPTLYWRRKQRQQQPSALRDQQPKEHTQRTARTSLKAAQGKRSRRCRHLWQHADATVLAHVEIKPHWPYYRDVLCSLRARLQRLRVPAPAIDAALRVCGWLLKRAHLTVEAAHRLIGAITHAVTHGKRTVKRIAWHLRNWYWPRKHRRGRSDLQERGRGMQAIVGMLAAALSGAAVMQVQTRVESTPVHKTDPDTSRIERYLHAVARSRQQSQTSAQRPSPSSDNDWLRSLSKQYAVEQSDDDGSEARRRYMEQLRAYQRYKYGDWQ